MAFQYNIVRMFENERTEGREEGRAEGRAEGEADGRTYNIIAQLRKKLQKGKSDATAADELEEDLDTIQPLYSLIKQYPAESDEEILTRYKELCKTADSEGRQ